MPSRPLTSADVPVPSPPQILIALVTLRVLPAVEGRNERATTVPDTEAWYIRNAKWVHMMLRLVMREAVQHKEPSTWQQLRAEILFLVSYAPNPNDVIVKELKAFVEAWPSQFEDIQSAFELLDAIPEIYIERDEDAVQNNHRVAALAPLGIFLRRIFLGYKVLTFAESCQLGRDVVDWCRGVGTSGSRVEDEGPGKNKGKDKARLLINKTSEINTTIDTRLDTFQQYQAAVNSGDYALALSSMSRFYDYQFPKTSKGLHQHALLNLASFHYSTGGLAVAKEAVDEAIKIARAAGDLPCLRHCLALSKRLNAELNPSITSIMQIGRPPAAGDLRGEGSFDTPRDEMWSIKHRLDLGERLPSAYARIYRAIGRQEAIEASLAPNYDRDLAEPPEPKTDAEKRLGEIPGTAYAQPGVIHAMQAALWDLFGMSSLVQLHEDLAFQSPPVNRDLDLSLTISRAQRLCRQSRSDEALAMLLESYTTEGMNMAEYHKWAEAVWDVVEFDALNREDEESLRIIASHRLPKGSYRQRGPGGQYRVLAHPDEEIKLDFFGRDKDDGPARNAERITRLLDRAVDIERDGPAPMIALPDLMSAVQGAEELGVWATYRTASVALADVMSRITVELDQGDEEQEGFFVRAAERELQPIWHQILRSKFDDLVWKAGWILARAKADAEPAAAVVLAKIALEAARNLQCRHGLIACTQLLALLYDALGDVKHRDIYANQWQAVCERRLSQSPVILGLGFDGVKGAEPAVTNLIEKSEVSSPQAVLLVQELVSKIGVKVALGWPA